jgi:hypothetical protein
MNDIELRSAPAQLAATSRLITLWLLAITAPLIAVAQGQQLTGTAAPHALATTSVAQGPLPPGAYEMTVHKSTGAPVTMVVAVVAPSSGVREVVCLDACPMLPTPSSSAWNTAGGTWSPPGSGTTTSSQQTTMSVEGIFAQISNGKLVANAALGPFAIAGQLNADGSLSGQITGPTTSQYPAPLAVTLVPHNLALAPGNYRLDGGHRMLMQNGKQVDVDLDRLLGVMTVSGNSTLIQVSPPPLIDAVHGKLSGASSGGLWTFTASNVSAEFGPTNTPWLLAATTGGAVMRDADLHLWKLTFLGPPGQFTLAPGAYTFEDSAPLSASTPPTQPLAVMVTAAAGGSATAAFVVSDKPQLLSKVQGNQITSLNSDGLSGILTGNNQFIGVQTSGQLGSKTHRSVVIQPMTGQYSLPPGGYRLQLAAGPQTATVTAASDGLITIKTPRLNWSGCTLTSNVLQCGTKVIGVLTANGTFDGSLDYTSSIAGTAAKSDPHFVKLTPAPPGSHSGNTDTNSTIAGTDSGDTPAASATSATTSSGSSSSGAVATSVLGGNVPPSVASHSTVMDGVFPPGAYQMTVHKSTGAPVTMVVAVVAPSSGVREVVCLDTCPMLPTQSSSTWNTGSGTTTNSQTPMSIQGIFAQVSNGKLVANTALGPFAIAGQLNSDGSLSGQITGPTPSQYPTPLAVTLVPHNLALAPGNYRVDGGKRMMTGKELDLDRLLGIVTASGNSTTIQVSPPPLTGAVRGQLSGTSSAGLWTFTASNASAEFGPTSTPWLLAATTGGAVMRDADLHLWKLTFLGPPGQFTLAPGAYTFEDSAPISSSMPVPTQPLAVIAGAGGPGTVGLVVSNQQQMVSKVQGNQLTKQSTPGVIGVLTGNNQIVGIKVSGRPGAETYRSVVIQPVTAQYSLPPGNYRLQLAAGVEAATVTAASDGLITIQTPRLKWSGCTLTGNVLQCGTTVIGVLTANGTLDGSLDYTASITGPGSSSPLSGPHFVKLTPAPGSSSNTDTNSTVAGTDSGNTPSASASSSASSGNSSSGAATTSVLGGNAPPSVATHSMVLGPLPPGAYEMTVPKVTMRNGQASKSLVTMVVGVVAPSADVREVVCLDECTMLAEQKMFGRVASGKLIADATLGTTAIAGDTSADGGLSGQINGPLQPGSGFAAPLSVSLVPHALALAPGNYLMDGGNVHIVVGSNSSNADLHRLLGVVSISGSSVTIQVSPQPLNHDAAAGQLSGTFSSGSLWTLSNASQYLGPTSGAWLLAATTAGAAMRDANLHPWKLTFLGPPGQFTWAPGAYTVDDGTLSSGSTTPTKVAVVAPAASGLAVYFSDQYETTVKVDSGNRLPKAASNDPFEGVLTGNNQVVGVDMIVQGTIKIPRAVVIQPITAQYGLPAGSYQLEFTPNACAHLNSTGSGTKTAVSRDCKDVTISTTAAGQVAIQGTDINWNCTLANNIVQCGVAMVGALFADGRLEGSYQYEKAPAAHPSSGVVSPYYLRLNPTPPPKPNGTASNTDTSGNSSAVTGSTAGSDVSAASGPASLARPPDVSTPVVSPPSPTMAKPADEIDIPATRSQ